MSHFSVVNSVLPLWRKQLPSRKKSRRLFIGISHSVLKPPKSIISYNFIKSCLGASLAILAQKFKCLKNFYFSLGKWNETFFYEILPKVYEFQDSTKILKAFPPWSIHPRISFSTHIFGFYSSSLSSSSNLKS